MPLWYTILHIMYTINYYEGILMESYYIIYYILHWILHSTHFWLQHTIILIFIIGKTIN